MVEAMFDRVLRRAWLETELLFLITVFSLSASSLLTADASIALGIERYDLTSVAARALELVFAVVWLSISTKMTMEMNKFRRKHFRTIFLLRRGRLDEEQKKGETTELVRDLVAFYRGYYRRVIAVLGLAIATGLSMIVAASILVSYGYMSFWEAVFRWILSSAMLLIASGFYIYVHRSWGRRLLRIRDAEKGLSEVLGGPIEA